MRENSTPIRSKLLVDVSDIPLSELLKLHDDALKASVETVLAQVARPRANLGGSGPPGRSD